jgi:hypothetical protein
MILDLVIICDALLKDMKVLEISESWRTHAINAYYTDENSFDLNIFIFLYTLLIS